MTEYQAKSNGSLSFDVTKGDSQIGKLIYQSWFTFNSTLELANGLIYTIEPKGFWGTTIELKDGDKVRLKFKMNWNGDIVIQTYFDGFEKGYVFKHKGIFKESFLLIDQDGIELLVTKPQIKWSKMNYEYQIMVSDAFEALANKEILLITSVHCANYYMSMMMAAGAPGA
ncbi:hypothetical protein [Spirosoma sp.]|uniref:hypothetical protein n=1 Tax=Spirosoma sp. TaxID=1899569 RepID=UPI003B3BC7C0